MIAPEIFRAYDIRGIVGQQLNEQTFYAIGKAVSCRLNALERSDIFVARDGRLTSECLTQALIQGLRDSGIRVVDLGAVATPVMYFATHIDEHIDSGLMVTGSHNPAEYNGIKLVLAKKTLADDDIQALYASILNQETLAASTIGAYEVRDIIPQYIARIVSDVKLKKPLKVVVDCGNGIAGPIVPQVLRELGCEVVELFCEVDGRFPNHHPDPSVEANLVDLKHAVLAHQADIGLAFDGDADRLGVVTNQGELIWPDRLMMMYARHLLKDNPGATIVYDVKCSSHLQAVIEAAGGVAKMCPTGHSIVKRVMKEDHALLAGEMSGHLFFKERWYGFDDALYSACRLLEMVSESSQTVDDQFLAIPNSINTPEIKIPIIEEEKFAFMHRFSQEAIFHEAKRIDIDGLRVEFEHGWGLIRASNTTPCLVARFEALDLHSLNRIKALFKTQMQSINAQLAIPF